MTNYDDEDDDRNKDGNNDDNAASVSGSEGPIFYWSTTPWSHGGGSGDNGDGAYGRGALYIYPFKDEP